MLEGKNSAYPHFQCPNCRAWTDLSAEVDVAEEDLEEWMDNAGESEDQIPAPVNAPPPPPSNVRREDDTAHIGTAISPEHSMQDADHEMDTVDDRVAEHTSNHPTTHSGLLARRKANQSASAEAASMNGIDLHNQLEPSTTNTTEVDRLGATTPDVGEVLLGEGPLTPRNNAGPFVFDGSAGRSIGLRDVPARGDISE
jgi:hypothetical protein